MMDLESLRSMVQEWSEELLQNEQRLSIIGRVAVLAGAALLASAWTWVASRVGWASLKLGGRGLRRLCRSKPADPLIAMLCRGIEESLLQRADSGMGEAFGWLVAFRNGHLDLDKRKVLMGAEGHPYEDITGRLDRAQKRKLFGLGKRLRTEAQAVAELERKRELARMVWYDDPAPRENCAGPMPCPDEPIASPDVPVQAMLGRAVEQANRELAAKAPQPWPFKS